MNKSNLEISFDKLSSLKVKSKNFFKGCSFSKEILFLATALESDFANQKKRNKSYISYKRGTLIHVDFGLNIGSELSGVHYALVLSKKDNPKNDKITVLPLTSKNGVNNIPLGFNISREIALHLAETGYNIANKKDNPFDIALTFIAISQEKQNGNESPTEKEFKQKLENDKEIRENIKKQMEFYMKSLEKISFIKIDNLTTISKFRIRKSKHQFDPIGKMILNDSYMNKIDSAVASYIIDN